jgi:hypothetical protein
MTAPNRIKSAGESKPEEQAHNESKLPGRLKFIGGSMSDEWNSAIANQVTSAQWLGKISPCGTQRYAAVEALIGIAPRDELRSIPTPRPYDAHHRLAAFVDAIRNRTSSI